MTNVTQTPLFHYSMCKTYYKKQYCLKSEKIEKEKFQVIGSSFQRHRESKVKELQLQIKD